MHENRSNQRNDAVLGNNYRNDQVNKQLCANDNTFPQVNQSAFDIQILYFVNFLAWLNNNSNFIETD